MVEIVSVSLAGNHDCNLPDPGNYSLGTIIRCGQKTYIDGVTIECNRQWLRDVTWMRSRPIWRRVPAYTGM